jgi:hypothetical protein
MPGSRFLASLIVRASWISFAGKADVAALGALFCFWNFAHTAGHLQQSIATLIALSIPIAKTTIWDGRKLKRDE